MIAEESGTGLKTYGDLKVTENDLNAERNQIEVKLNTKQMKSHDPTVTVK